MGFMRGNRKEPNPMSQLMEDKLKPVPELPGNDMLMPEPPMGDIGLPVQSEEAETTQPGDEGKKSKKKKGTGKGGTILTSVTGVSGSPELGKPTLLGGSY
tara:strand:- start:64 stop:363 length:300 start_codon:yes stop_codon:yes gene_type:complete